MKIKQLFIKRLESSRYGAKVNSCYLLKNVKFAITDLKEEWENLRNNYKDNITQFFKIKAYIRKSLWRCMGIWRRLLSNLMSIWCYL